ncbi:methyltransferase domain-containing protein [Streptomyces avicenniae]|uniref:methyltransferase domain-containing protein n=1 Tax=Streptomyces avicenniae TaxID=500153 RepID=UPI00069C725C|nr:methyltransferase domain-containing protein [Streptomyces avicenniae]
MDGFTGPVRVIDVGDERFRRVFEAFLAGTDEKAAVHPYLTDIVTALPERGVWLDAGAGEGVTTRHLAPYFAATVAVEPGAHLRARLRSACPTAVIVTDPVLRAGLDLRADFALFSHVLYYLPPQEWRETVLRLLGWVKPGRELVVLLQNPEDDCMRMVREFTGVRMDLAALADELAASGDGLVGDVSLRTLPATYRAATDAAAWEAAEFMLNVPQLAAMEIRPDRADLAAYVRGHFSRPGGGYAIGHANDVLRVRRAAGPRQDGESHDVLT